MTVFCTYCSAEKYLTQGELPAVDRYRSRRIKAVYMAAHCLGFPFLILSGKFGILRPNDPIPHYDHLLELSEVPEHAAKVSVQLAALGVKEIVFFARSIEEDAHVRPYVDCMKLAAAKLEIELKHVTLPAD